jgi:hypothetical protein
MDSPGLDTPATAALTSPTPLESRLAVIERQLAALTADVAAIRAELDAPVEGRPQVAAPMRRIVTSRRPLSAQDLEGLLGRYGMLGIAVLAAVAAVGTFLSWAIGRGYLTLDPAARVLVGLAFAGGVAVWGVKLRRTERSFGSSMLGLALVIEQVCAYAAGPSFHLVPTWVAFAGAAVASWALAIFAHAENDELLWCVGFGGAALAPFVTSDGHGNVFALVGYGAVVLLPACFAISHRGWPIGWRVFYLASALYVVAAAIAAHTAATPGFLIAFAFPFAIAAAGVVPFAPESRKRGALRWLGSLAVLGGLAYHAAPGEPSVVATALLAGVCAWLLILDRHARVPQSSILARGREVPAVLDWIDGAGIPLLLAVQAVNVIALPAQATVAYGAATIAFALFAWRRSVSPLRDAAAFAAVGSAFGVVEFLPLEAPTARVAAVLALGLAAFAMHKLRPSRSWLATGSALLLFAGATAISELLARRPYVFPPFTTVPSATALLVTAAFVLLARFWYWVRVATRESIADRPEWTYAGSLRVVVRAVTLAPWVWAFVWVLIELSMAYSPSTATLLLVTYFAATAVGCVATGRVRHSARLRQLGLALALVAASTAFFGATSYFDFATRIAAYLVTSAFLLGIAYWYRRPGLVAD